MGFSLAPAEGEKVGVRGTAVVLTRSALFQGRRTDFIQARPVQFWVYL